MPLKTIFFQLMWTILIMQTFGKVKRTDETIFDNDYCNVKCGNKIHTMCPIKNLTPACSNFELYRFDLDQYEDELKVLVHGHNGVRNRIAERMQVPNMLEMAWDRKLALMAENYLHQCPDRLTDPCTLDPEIFNEDETINEFFKFNISVKYIAQNTFYEQSHFYPFRFLERVIRSWYFEKDGMRQPSITEDEKWIKRLMGENNFTHFAYPFIFRFGCAMAKYKGGFHILCNYYPFYRTVTNTMLFQTGIPVAECPARYPLRDEMFNSLCTDESEDFFKHGNDESNGKNLIGFDVKKVLAFEFAVLYFFYFYY